MLKTITVYKDTDVGAMLERIAHALDVGEGAPESEPRSLADVRPAESLIGIDPRVYSQINTALRSGKRHLLFYGPPGTGKTELAQLVAGQLADDWHLLTGSADWSSQDVIGGYMPAGGGQLQFSPGLLLQHFNDPLIIDELNRCDIDKVLGPLFTVLSGQGTTLPYHFDPTQPGSPRVSIHPPGGPTEAGPRFVPGERWRLIATINTLDRTSLYQMSYALMRRFAWIYVGIPAKLDDFIAEYVRRHYMIKLNRPCVLAAIWSQFNVIRPLGPAPFIDIIKYLRELFHDFDFAAAVSAGDVARRQGYLDALDVFVLPMLDGVRPEQAEALSAALAPILGMPADLEKALRDRLLELAA